LCENIISGKDGFRDSKLKMGHQEDEVEEMWKRLPAEAKRKWKAEGLGADQMKKNKLSSVIFTCSEVVQSNTFDFLHKS
jgi:hypothetical protein